MHPSIMPRILLLAALLTGLLMASTTHAEQYAVNAFGDSLTSGYPYWTGMDGNGCLPSSCRGGYREPLQTLLKNAGRDARVENWGRRADTTSSGLARFDSVLNKSKPRYILLMEGTNELYFGSAETVRANLANMIDKAKAKGVIPVLGTFTPDPRYPEKNLPQANALLKELALQKDIALADHYGALKSNWANLCTSDRIHPNQAGYSIMAQIWFNSMKTLDLTPIIMLLLDD